MILSLPGAGFGAIKCPNLLEVRRAVQVHGNVSGMCVIRADCVGFER